MTTPVICPCCGAALSLRLEAGAKAAPEPHEFQAGDRVRCIWLRRTATVVSVSTPPQARALIATDGDYTRRSVRLCDIEMLPCQDKNPREIRRGDRVRFLDACPGLWRPGATGTVVEVEAASQAVTVSIDRLRRIPGAFCEYSTMRPMIELIPEAA